MIESRYDMKTETFTFQNNYGCKFRKGIIIGDRKRHFVIDVKYEDSIIVTCTKLSKKWWVKFLQIIYLKLHYK